MRRSIVLVLVLAAAAAACGKKKEADKAPGGSAAGSGSGATAGTGSAATGSGTAGTHSATAQATGALKPVTECPPALKESDAGLQRTIPSGCTTTVEGEYYMDGELIIEPGVVVKFAAGASMHIGYTGTAKLIVKGTADKPVTFTAGGDPVPGSWKGVTIYSRAVRSSISGLVIEDAETALDLQALDVSITDSTFRAAKDLELKVSDDVTLAAFTNNTFDKPPAMAMSLPPSALGGIGAGNKLPADTMVELRGGQAQAAGTWPNLGAPIRVTGEVYLDGKPGKITVELAAGSTYKFEPKGAIYVGYTNDAELKVSGTAEAPVTFDTSGDPAPAAWPKGIISYDHGTLTIDHAVIKHGGAESQGAVRAQGGTVSITSSSFEDNQIGFSVDDPVELTKLDQTSFRGNQDEAMILFPRQLGGLGSNTYADGQLVLVHGGNADRTATWAPQTGAKVRVDGEVYVDGGTVIIPAGASYEFTDSGGLYVGYNKDATLNVQGTAAQPVSFRGSRDETGAWKGLELYSHAVASSIAHLVVRDGTGSACVRASGGAVLTIDTLTGGKCENGLLTWDCQSKVTQTGVKADKGTKGALAPTDC